MESQYTFLIILVAMVGLMFFTQRSQKKQAQKRMEGLNKLQKGYEVITIGGLYGTVLPLKETASLEGAIEK